MGWQQINTWARMVSPDPEPLWLQAAPWSPATKGPVTGQVVYLDLATADDKALDDLKGTLAGKIVLLGAIRPTPDITEPLFHRYTDEELKEMESYPTQAGRPGAPHQTGTGRGRARPTSPPSAPPSSRCMAAEERPAAIITPSRDGGKGGGTGIIFDDNGANLARAAQTRENAVTIPNAVMMIEHYNRLARLAQHHVPVTLEVNIETKFTGDHEHGFDTVAEIPGTDPRLKDPRSSWSAATLTPGSPPPAPPTTEPAPSSPWRPCASSRPSTFSPAAPSASPSGPEKRKASSAPRATSNSTSAPSTTRPPTRNVPAFLRTHGPLKTTKEWETLDAYYNLDNGTGKVRGVYTQENYAIGPIFKQWIAPLADLGVTTISYRNTGGTDHLSYDAVGLPGFQFIQDPMDYETRTHHSDMDTVDRLHPFDLEQAAVVEAIFLYNTSERDEMMPRKPFPHPEQDKQRNAPLPGLYPESREAKP